MSGFFVWLAVDESEVRYDCGMTGTLGDESSQQRPKPFPVSKRRESGTCF